MANWSLPSLSDLYSNVLSLLKERDDDCAKMFDGVGTQLKEGFIRWNSGTSRFEKLDADLLTWTPLADEYEINVSSFGGSPKSFFLPASNYTALDVLSKVKTVDGGDSGLDTQFLGGLDNTKFNNVVFSYRTTSSLSGALKIILPFNANSEKRLKFTVSVYSGDVLDEYKVSGHLRSAINNWSAAKYTYSGDNNRQLIFGRNPDGAAYITVPFDSYVGIAVSNLVLGYNGTDEDTSNHNWTYELSPASNPNQASSTKITQWSSGNHGVGTGLNADMLDGLHASEFAVATQGALADSAMQLADGTSWLYPTLLNGFAIIGSLPTNALKYKKLPSGMVVVTGNIYSYSTVYSATQFAVLPAGFRPVSWIDVDSKALDFGSKFVRISPDGSMSLFSTDLSGANLRFSIVFYAEN